MMHNDAFGRPENIAVPLSSVRRIDPGGMLGFLVSLSCLDDEEGRGGQWVFLYLVMRC